MYLIIDDACLKRIMKEIREDQNFRLWKAYAKYSTMEIKKIIKYHWKRIYEASDYDVKKEILYDK